jgi:CRP-like cAMP-binding protein
MRLSPKKELSEMSVTEMPALFPGHWFREMPAPLAQQLAELAHRRPLRNGDYVYRMGEPAEGLYQLVKGRLRLGATLSSRQFTIAYADSGDWIGEVPLLDGLPHATDAVAISDGEILVVPKRQLEILLERQPELYQYFARRLAFAMRLAVGYYADLASLPLPARMAKRLLELGAVYGEPVENGTRIGLRLPQEVLAGMLATSRQSINKELKIWEARGWIAVKYNTIVLSQPEALRKLLLEAE